MVGCCGGGGGGAGQKAMGAQGAGMGGSNFRDVNNKRCVSNRHDEEVCHGTNERRRDLLDQMKIFLNEFDERPCQNTPPQTGPDALKPLGQYPEYHRKHCMSWMPSNPQPPLITSVQTHEIRPTENFEVMQANATEYVSYKDAKIKPPVPTCECAKRNGLQDQCSRPECTPPTPQCLATNPGPCCPPSLGLTREEAARGQQPPQFQQPGQQQPQQYSGQPPSGPGYQQGQGRPPPGMQMVCFCEESPSNMQSGTKYICCPRPL